MAVNGGASIFRLSSAGNNTETLVSDKIEFGGDAMIPDAKWFLTSVRPVYTAINTDNPNPGSTKSPNSQDTGNAPFMLELKGYFDESSSTTLGISTFIVNWIQNRKVVKTHYPKGRFGFRSDDRPEFNVTPDSTGGYQFVSFDAVDPIEEPKTRFTILLKFVGDMARFDT